MNESLAQVVASEVRAEMARQGVTHRALAEHMDLPQPSVTRRLNGQIVFNVAELESVADFLGVPVAQFLSAPADAA